MIYLISCKNLCKCCNVSPPSTTIKTTTKEYMVETTWGKSQEVPTNKLCPPSRLWSQLTGFPKEHHTAYGLWVSFENYLFLENGICMWIKMQIKRGTSISRWLWYSTLCLNNIYNAHSIVFFCLDFWSHKIDINLGINVLDQKIVALVTWTISKTEPLTYKTHLINGKNIICKERWKEMCLKMKQFSDSLQIQPWMMSQVNEIKSEIRLEVCNQKNNSVI
jgi:hypothetical protein